MSNRIRGILAALGIGMIAAMDVSASPYTWAGVGADNKWDTAANWDLGVPDAADDVVFATGFTSGTTINLNGNRTVASLTVNTITSFSVTNSTLTITSGRITRNDVSGNEGNQYVNSAITLGADAAITCAGSANLFLNAASGNATVSASGGSVMMFGTNTYNGATRVTAGTFGLTGSNGTALNSSAFYLNGGTLSLLGGAGSSLPSQGNNNDRIGDGAGIILNSQGTFRVENGASAGGIVSENTGRILLNSGQSTLETSVVGPSATRTVTLTADQLIRLNRSTALVRGTGLGGIGDLTSRIVFDVETPTGAMLGGGGAAGSTRISIIPWLNGEGSLVTYDAVAGSLRPLAVATEFVTNSVGSFPSASANDNVRLLSSAATTYNLTSNTNINALVLANGGGNSSVSGAYRLTLGSGVVAAFGSINAAQTLGMSELDFNGQEGFVYFFPSGNRLLTISAVMTNTAGKGVTFAGGVGNNNGTHLAGANVFTGPVTINSGLVQGDHVRALPAATPLIVRRGWEFGEFRSTVGASGGERLTVASIAGGGRVSIGGDTKSLNIGGDRTVGANGAFTMTGGSLEPGDYPAFTNTLATGTLSLRNNAGSVQNVTMALKAGTLKIDIASSNAFDVLDLYATGSTTLTLSDTGAGVAGATLEVTLGYGPTAGTQFQIVTVAGSQLISGKFSNGDAVSSTYNGKEYLFTILYTGGNGNGNDVVLVSEGEVVKRGTAIYIR